MSARRFLRGFLRALLLGAACGASASRAQDYRVYEGAAIPAEIETMYARGLQYLVRSQAANGSWADASQGPHGIAALATLAMLAHGDDPNDGPCAGAIRRALDFLITSQNARTGYIGASMYNHGFATLALAESYGAVDDPRIGPALQRAVDLILSSQQRNRFGAWRYSPDADDADTTVSGAQIVALLAARNAGLAVPDDALQRALLFYRYCQSGDGGIGYTGPDSGNGPRTAIGVLCYALARKKDAPTYRNALRFLETAMEGDGYAFYFLYYNAQALFQSDMRLWQRWNQDNARWLRESQAGDGSWNDDTAGTTFGTSTALLSLALNYRFLPIYER